MKKKKFIRVLLSLCLVASIVLASCAAEEEEPPPPPSTNGEPPPPPPDATAVEITVSAKFATFQPSTITVAKGQTVKLTIASTDIGHTFTINELGINVSVGAGQTVTREFTVEEAGTFAFYCAVPGHRGAGMEGTFNATE